MNKEQGVKIIRVKDWENLPEDFRTFGGKKLASDTMAFTNPKTREIYVLEDKPLTEMSIEHEKGHLIKHHPAWNYKPENHVRDEIEAHLYAYQRTGKPKRLIMEIRALHQDLVQLYKIPFNRTRAIIRRNIMRPNIPQQWKNDFAKLYASRRF